MIRKYNGKTPDAHPLFRFILCFNG